jgi:hypothetical protein
MLIIRCERPRGGDGSPVWLKSMGPVPRWGVREQALAFANPKEAASAIRAINAPGRLILEEA